MNFRIFLSAALIAVCAFNISSKTPQRVSKAHQEAHRAQLAANKSRIDKSVISDFIREDIIATETSKNSLSAESSSMIADLLDEARTHIGKRYVHGSKGPNTFDCSGFSSYVYRQFGYSLSPSSRTQYTQGEPVDRHDLRQGDLVFFTSRSSGKNVGHVGIVVSADNDKGTFKFIHASIKGVKISDFEGYYVSRYIGARRVITE